MRDALDEAFAVIRAHVTTDTSRDTGAEKQQEK